jgi:hypothetical protein
MRVGAKRLGGRGQLKGIYLVPERRVRRAQHIPAGRTLHLVDLENLMRGPVHDISAIAYALREYRMAAAVSSTDHVVLAVNPALAVDAGRAWPGARLRIGGGPDGADEALLHDVSDRQWVAERYDRVVIGSGDGIFAFAAAEFQSLGIAVGVVAPEHGVSHRLRRYASFVHLLRVSPALQVVA